MKRKIIKRLLILFAFVLVFTLGSFFGYLKGYNENQPIPFGGDIYTEVNAYRQTQGLDPLTTSFELNGVAMAKCDDMMHRNYFAHQNPEGQYIWQQYPFKYAEAGENLANSYATATDVVRGWINSPEHQKNLVKSAYKEVGYGVCGNQPSFIVVQVLRG